MLCNSTTGCPLRMKQTRQECHWKKSWTSGNVTVLLPQMWSLTDTHSTKEIEPKVRHAAHFSCHWGSCAIHVSLVLHKTTWSETALSVASKMKACVRDCCNRATSSWLGASQPAKLQKSLSSNSACKMTDCCILDYSILDSCSLEELSFWSSYVSKCFTSPVYIRIHPTVTVTMNGLHCSSIANSETWW